MKVNAITCETRYTPMHVASQFGSMRKIKELGFSDAMPDAQDKFGNTALHYACGARFRDISTAHGSRTKTSTTLPLTLTLTLITLTLTLNYATVNPSLIPGSSLKD